MNKKAGCFTTCRLHGHTLKKSEEDPFWGSDENECPGSSYLVTSLSLYFFPAIASATPGFSLFCEEPK